MQIKTTKIILKCIPQVLSQCLWDVDQTPPSSWVIYSRRIKQENYKPAKN